MVRCYLHSRRQWVFKHLLQKPAAHIQLLFTVKGFGRLWRWKGPGGKKHISRQESKEQLQFPLMTVGLPSLMTLNSRKQLGWTSPRCRQTPLFSLKALRWGVPLQTRHHQENKINDTHSCSPSPPWYPDSQEWQNQRVPYLSLSPCHCESCQPGRTSSDHSDNMTFTQECQASPGLLEIQGQGWKETFKVLRQLPKMHHPYTQMLRGFMGRIIEMPNDQTSVLSMLTEKQASPKSY